MKFALWALKMLPLLVFMTFQSDVRDGASKPHPTYATTVLLLCASFLMFGFPAAIFLTGLCLYFLVPDSWRRMVTRAALIIGPASLLGLVVNRQALLFLVTALAALLVLAGQRNFLASIALVAQSGDALDDVERRLTGVISRLVREHGRLVIVAHSMGAYLVFRALIRLNASKSALLNNGNVQVIGIGSGVKPLTVLRIAGRTRSWTAFGWGSLIGICFGLTGTWLVTLVFIGFGRHHQLKGASAFERWFGPVAASDNPARAVQEWFRDQLIGRSLVVLFTPIGVGLLLLVVGVLLARWCQVRMKRVLEGKHRTSLPGGSRWIDCYSVHDTVGRSKWPVIRNLLPVPLSGMALPMADHPLGRYLRATSPVVRLVSTAVDDVRVSQSDLTTTSRELLVVSDHLDRKRDVVFVATVAFLYAITGVGTVVGDLLGVTGPLVGTWQGLAVLGTILILGSIWRILAGIRTARQPVAFIRAKIAAETLQSHGDRRRTAVRVADILLGFVVMFAAALPQTGMLSLFRLNWESTASYAFLPPLFRESVIFIVLLVGLATGFAAVLIWFTDLGGLRQQWPILALAGLLACASLVLTQMIFFRSPLSFWTVMFSAVIVGLTSVCLVLRRRRP